MRLRWITKSVAVAALVGVPLTANAETIDFRGSGLNAAVSISVLNAAGSLVTNSVAAGELNWAWLNGTPEGFEGQFFSYCVDALNALRDPQTVVVDTTENLALSNGNRPASTDAGDKVAWLFNTYAGVVHASGSGAAAAGLQVAIWEALYDSSSFSLTGGNFRLNNNSLVGAQATTFLTSLYSSNYSGSSASWLNTSYGQDQITHGVPEPATLLLMGVGLLALRRKL